MADLAESSLADLVDRVAATDPTPGAGPTAAWTCALAAALLEMVSRVTLRKEPDDPAAVQARLDRAAVLRGEALALADRDAAAYTSVLAVQRRRDEPGHGGRLRAALSDAADPLMAIVEAAAEIAQLAADAAGDARGGVRGEAMTAAILAEAVARAGRPLIDLNLAGSPDDPRRGRVAELAAAAEADRDRATGG